MRGGSACPYSSEAGPTSQTRAVLASEETAPAPRPPSEVIAPNFSAWDPEGPGNRALARRTPQVSTSKNIGHTYLPASSYLVSPTEPVAPRALNIPATAATCLSHMTDVLLLG